MPYKDSLFSLKIEMAYKETLFSLHIEMAYKETFFFFFFFTQNGTIMLTYLSTTLISNIRIKTIVLSLITQNILL